MFIPVYTCSRRSEASRGVQIIKKVLESHFRTWLIIICTSWITFPSNSLVTSLSPGSTEYDQKLGVRTTGRTSQWGSWPHNSIEGPRSQQPTWFVEMHVVNICVPSKLWVVLLVYHCYSLIVITKHILSEMLFLHHNCAVWLPLWQIVYSHFELKF